LYANIIFIWFGLVWFGLNNAQWNEMMGSTLTQVDQLLFEAG
jgi:hypothetical protein